MNLGGVLQRHGSGTKREPGHPALGGVIVVMIVFLAVLTKGYFNYATLLWPGLPDIVNLLLGFAIACAALILARATAGARMAARSTASGTSGNFAVWLPFFVILLVVSALGTLNALYFFFEGSDVVTQRVASVRAQVNQLTIRGGEALKDPELDNGLAEITRKLAVLHQQITEGSGSEHDLSCGVGELAAGFIREIGTILATEMNAPGYTINPLTTKVHDCRRKDELERIYAQYDSAAKLQFEGSPFYREHRGKERLALLKQLHDTELLSASLAGTSDAQMSAMTGDSIDVRQAKEQLRNLANSYSATVSAIKTFTGRGLGVGDELYVTDVNGLGNIGHVVADVLFRFNRYSLLYFLFAVGLDALMVWGFSVLMQVYSESSRRDAALLHYASDEEAKVHFLWTYKERQR